MKSTKSQSLTTDFFEALYRENPDPWQFATSEYEAQKYATTLNALPRDRYESVFEIGGSIGIFTERLANRCDYLLSVDVSSIAQEQAKQRCGHLDCVDFKIMCVPDEFPDKSFDLILLSEVGYYWCWDDFYKAQNLMLDRLKPQGHLAIVHWTVDAKVLPLTGDEVHDAFVQLVPDRLAHLHSLTTDKYRLDVFEKL
jgi:SAM-dependent methyltransferase